MNTFISHYDYELTITINFSSIEYGPRFIYGFIPGEKRLDLILKMLSASKGLQVNPLRSIHFSPAVIPRAYKSISDRKKYF